MATLIVTQTIDNDVYSMLFSIDPASISEDDMNRINKFGPPKINLGGWFNTDLFQLPDEYFTLPNNSPVKRCFTLVAPFDTNSMTRLGIYRTEMETRIIAAFTALKAETDTFTGQHLTNI